MEDQSARTLNALILRDFSDVGIFFNWLLRARPVQRYMGLADNFANNPTGFDFAERTNLRRVFGPAKPGGGASFEPNTLRRH